MKIAAVMLLVLLRALPLAAQTTNNDDSCDISVTPAATLLLPYFEVDLAKPADVARTTLFTITNVSAKPQIARATIWTDLAYPLFTFDIFLTGYDVATVDLHDLIGKGRIPRSRTTRPPGPLSASNFANPNHHATMRVDCASRPNSIPAVGLTEMQLLLTSHRFASDGQCPRGATIAANRGHHPGVAIGYVTIDVVATCSSWMPNSAEYFLSDLLFDNVLIGDWMIIQPDQGKGNYAAGSPLVHIRAIPEGGPAGSVVPTNLPFTFHDRLTNTLPAHLPRTFDRRQPLPATFAARYVQGGANHFQTRFLVWREALTGSDATCDQYAVNAPQGMTEVIRFDEHENASVRGNYITVLPLPNYDYVFPTSSLLSSSDYLPPMISPRGDVAGWLFFNLSHGGSPAYSTAPGRDFNSNNAVVRARKSARHNQSWLISMMHSEGRYAVAVDAAVLANGCSLASAEPGPGANLNP